MALPLINRSSLDGAIELLINNIPSSDDLLLQFVDYFRKQWCTCVSPKYWNLGSIHLRCNNSVEGRVCSDISRTTKTRKSYK